jgi:hypothetical protein
MSHFDENLALLIDHHPHLNNLLDVTPSTELKVVPSRSGRPTALLADRYIHSRFDPIQEARRILEQECAQEATTYLFYGFGLGYLVEAFLNSHPDKSAVVVEPDRSLFIKALESRDLKGLITSAHLSYFVGGEPEALPRLLDTLPSAHLKVIPLRSVIGWSEAYYSRVDGIIRSYATRKKINLNTLARFGKLWVKNLTQNIHLLLRAPGIKKLENVFAGMPALVLASGPSLDSMLPFLHDLQQRFLTIAVDTSLRACLERKVEPDFLVIVDPQYWNTRHIDGANPRKTILVSESSTNPRVFRKLHIPTFIGSSLFPLGRHLESAIGKKGALGAGGSVATTAWDLARLAGCNPIYVAGLDLGFPARATHFKGAYFENQFHAHSSRLRSSEEMSFSLLYQALPFAVASNAGGTVMTDQRMIIYKWWFENQIKIFPETKTFTLSPAGVQIEGMTAESTQTLLRFPKIRDRIDKKTARIRQLQAEGTDPSLRSTLERSIKKLIEELCNLRDLASQALVEVKTLETALGSGATEKHQVEILDKIDSKILSMSSRDVPSFLLQSLIRRIEDEGAQESASLDPLKSSRELYNELKGSASYHLKYLEKALAVICKSDS